VLKDDLIAKAREFSKAKTLSAWINRHRRQEIEARLAAE
jgi:hypothetical protein